MFSIKHADIEVGNIEIKMKGLHQMNHKLEKLLPKELIGLYRDDGLAVTSLDQTWTDCLKRW